jgi:hypothetical protein
MYFLGLLSGIIFYAILGLAFYLGYRFSDKIKGKFKFNEAIIPKSITDNPELSEEQKNKLKQIQEGWQNILNYDVNVALQRKKVQ